VSCNYSRNIRLLLSSGVCWSTIVTAPGSLVPPTCTPKYNYRSRGGHVGEIELSTTGTKLIEFFVRIACVNSSSKTSKKVHGPIELSCFIQEINVNTIHYNCYHYSYYIICIGQIFFSYIIYINFVKINNFQGHN